jgi:hypothetical protein
VDFDIEKVPANRYIVYSVRNDGGEDESYADLVIADSAKAAEEWVEKARPYASVEFAVTLRNTLRDAFDMASESDIDVLYNMRTVAEDTCHDCPDCAGELSGETRLQEIPTYCKACDREIDIKDIG